MNRIVFCCLFLFYILTLQAQTTVSAGLVSGTWTKANAPYIIDGDLFVSENSSLIIEAGTTVLFNGHYNIKVHGSIKAIGTEGDSIHFAPVDTTGFSDYYSETGWSGIRLSGNTSDTSIFSHCIIEFSKAYHSEVEYYNKLNSGAAFYIEDYRNIIIEHCRLTNNYALYAGGAIYMYGTEGIVRNNTIMYNKTQRGSTLNAGSASSILNNTIAYNIAGNGGGIGCGDVTIVSGNLICNNRVTDTGANGAGISCSGNPVVVNNIIANNSAVNKGGTSHGGGMSFSTLCSPRLVSNNIIAHNWSEMGGAIDAVNAHVTIKNSIFYGNSSYHYLMEGSVRLENCIFIKPQDFSRYSGTNLYPVDPGFVSPSAGLGYTFDALHADWSLSDTSYCINTGNPETNTILFPTDMIGNDRIIHDIIDLGPLEFNGIIKNRRPHLSPIDPISMTSNTEISILIEFWDPDSMDDHTVDAFADNENIEVMVIDTSETVWMNIRSLNNWTGGAEIFFSLNDNSGQNNAKALNSFSLQVNDTVCGEISMHTTWGCDTVFINCNTKLADDKVLTILPGTVIQFLGNYSFEAIGTVIARGTEDERIEFLAKDTTEGWKGIKYENGFHAYGHPAGAMNNNDSSIFSYCTFTYCSGEAFFIDDFSRITIENSCFHRNRRSIIHTHEANPFIIGNLISNNDFVNRAGSPIWVERFSDPVIWRNEIVQNINALCGGIYCDYQCSPDIRNNLIAENQGRYGGILCEQSGADIINNTIVSNISEYGGGIYCKYSRANIVNTILWNNRAPNLGDQIYAYGTSPEVQYCVIEDFENSALGISVNELNSTLYSFDPGFINEAHNYHLSSASYCINGGSNEYALSDSLSKDLYGNQRIVDSIIDIGACEFQGVPDPLAPYNLSLYPGRISENMPSGSYVGKFSVQDPNRYDTFSYALTDGSEGNDKDNYRFSIREDSLFSSETLDFEQLKECAIYANVQDGDGNSYSKPLKVEIRNVNEYPEFLNPIPDLNLQVGEEFVYTVPENTFWREESDYFSYFAYQAGTESLPSWINLYSYQGTFSGTATQAEEYQICLYVRDYPFISEIDTFLITVTDILNQIEEATLNEVQVYPNPFQSGLYLSNITSDRLVYSIYDNFGRKVIAESILEDNATLYLDYSVYSSGIYYIKIQYKDGPRFIPIFKY